MKPLFLSAILLAATGGPLWAAEIKPNLKVLLCTGDYGMYAQDRVPMIQNAVEKAAPDSNVSWEAHQSFNFTKVLENPGYARRFDAVVMGDLAIGQLTPLAQRNLVDFAQNGGGIVWALWAKSTLPFKGSEDAVAMPLKAVLPVAYPNFSLPAEGATTLAATDPFWAGIDFAPLTQESIVKKLPELLRERAAGKGRVLTLAGAFGPSWKKIAYATHEKVPGGWDAFPGLGEVWSRVLERASQNSPVRSQSRAVLDAKIANAPLTATIRVNATQTTDAIRAANFSIVALQQLYNEDGGKGEELFLDLNPRDWFDRRSQEVLPNTKGIKSDKPAFFKEFNIQGIHMGGNSYGSYGKWKEETYAKETALAVEGQKKYPAQLRFFQAGNEPPLDAKYVAFHKKFVGAVLQGAPEYKVIGPNKAFNVFGVDPKEMQFYIDECGPTTDILNWHTYAQPPSTTLSEARYWSDRATGKMRTAGAPPVMFTESDAWNQGESQFNYLMERAFTFLPEKRIIGTFQYCMRPRSEGGTYKFGVLQPEGPMSANYNGYWVWRNLRGQMTQTTLETPLGRDHLRAISSRSDDGKTFTTVVFYGAPYFDGTSGKRASKASVTIEPQLPPGNYQLEISDVKWNERKTREGSVGAPVKVELEPYSAVALTWKQR